MNTGHTRLKDLPKEIRDLADEARYRQRLRNNTDYLICYFDWRQSKKGFHFWKKIDKDYARKRNRLRFSKTNREAADILP